MTQGPASQLMLRLYQPRRTCRTGWNEIEHECEMATVAADLLGPSMRQCGDELWWHCPFHDGYSPSLWVAVGESALVVHGLWRRRQRGRTCDADQENRLWRGDQVVVRLGRIDVVVD